MQKHMLFVLATAAMLPIHANARDTSHGSHGPVSDQVIIEQEVNLAKNTENKGFGPQAPRDIDAVEGNNPIIFNTAPPYTQMNLCNIHFHKNAEHKGGEFTVYAGNGDGHGYETGFK